MGISRKIKNNMDLEKFSVWFANHDQFDVCDGSPRSLASGIHAEIQNGIKCDHAEDVGTKSHQKMDHDNVLDVSI